MSQRLKYISRIKDEFDTVICGMNGVITRGSSIDAEQVTALIKIYQSGKKIMLASNSGQRVGDLFRFLKERGVPMNIFYAMISAGEIAHFYLKNNHSLGQKYFPLRQFQSLMMRGLDYTAVTDIRMADFVLAETDMQGLAVEKVMPLLEEALRCHLPLVCVGNNISVITEDGVCGCAGAVAEQYAMQGGEIIPFGKPDIRIAAYLSESIIGFDKKRCLVIGDCMATDIRLGNAFKAQTLFLTGGVHQIDEPTAHKVDELAAGYGLSVDYYTEALQW